MIRHIILVKFKNSVDHANIHHLEKLFTAMAEEIDDVLAVEWGVNDSPEMKNKGFTHSILMTFEDDKARENYLPHPKHEILKQYFAPLIDDLVVFDYQI